MELKRAAACFLIATTLCFAHVQAREIEQGARPATLQQESSGRSSSETDYGALGVLVQAVGAIVSATVAIGLAWRRGGNWTPAQEDLPKAAERVGGLLTAVVISLLWALYNNRGQLPFLSRTALVCSVSALISFLIYGFLVSLQTYRQAVPAAAGETSIKIVGGFWLTPHTRERTAAGKDIQTLFKEANYNPDRIWTRGGRALAQALFALFFILLTFNGTVGLSAAAMVYLINQTPLPPVPIAGLSLAIFDNVSRGAGTTHVDGRDQTTVGYQVQLNDLLLGQVSQKDINSGVHFVFDSIPGRRQLTIHNDAGMTWACVLDIHPESRTFAITALSGRDCAAGPISDATYTAFIESHKQEPVGKITLMFEGATEVSLREGVTASSRTPNNNENHGNCPNKVGYHDGRYCTSRTPAQLSTTPPHFWRNATSRCQGAACPWADVGPVSISADRLTASGYIDNWGSDVELILTADEYQTVSAADCGLGTTEEISKRKAARFSVPKQCARLASLKWELPNGAAGTFVVGRNSSPGGEVVLDGEIVDRGTSTVVAYRLRD